MIGDRSSNQFTTPSDNLMPDPKPNESKSHFIPRCIAYVKENEGIEDNDHAAAKCHGIWRQHKQANNMLQQITINLAGNVRKTTWRGREYIVAPMTMIVPGVLAGNRGPLYYPPEEIESSTDSWNGVPIVLDHPTINGQPVSAKNPDVLDQFQLGEVHNAKYEGQLISEAYFDVEAVRRIDEGILNSLESNRPIELSTGLHVDTDANEGTFNGKRYTAIARNHRPDHLAILRNGRGACSIQDGCGVLVNSDHAIVLAQNEENEWTPTDDELVSSQLVTNQSLDDTRRELQRQLDRQGGGMVVEVFRNAFVYEKGETLWRLPYKVRNEVVMITDASPQKVQLYTRYVPTEGSLNNNAKGEDMNKEQLVNSLIEKCDCWDEDDRPVLNKMTEKKLQDMNKTLDDKINAEAVANAARKGFYHGDQGYTFNEDKMEFEPTNQKQNVQNQNNQNNDGQGQPKSFQDWIKEAPPEVARVVQNAMSWESGQKEQCIEKIVANESNTLTKEQLQSMPLETLQGIASLAGQPSGTQSNVPGTPPSIFTGAASPTVNIDKRTEPEEEPLALPVMNWEAGQQAS